MLSRFLTSLFILSLCFSLHGMEDDPYQKALNFRDGKIKGYTQEESTNEAESLFLTLAEEGNPKAMHNFALIQYRKNRYDLAFEWFDKAALNGLAASKNNIEKMIKDGNIKQTLYLIVGSKRLQGETTGPLTDAIVDHKASDLTHLQTFGGKATSMDLDKCHLEDQKHIKGNAITFDFSNYTIHSVLIERLSTVEPSNLSDNLENLCQNYLGSCIQNISKFMRPGAIMEIEWLPYTGMYVIGGNTLEECVQKNPFHSFLDLNVTLQSIFVLGGDLDNLNHFPKEFSKRTVEMADRVRELLTFYHQRGVGESLESLVFTAYWEARVVLEMIKKETCVFLDYTVFNQDYRQLTAAFEKAIFFNFPNETIGKKIAIQCKNGEEKLGMVYNLQYFLGATFLNYMVQDLAAELNRPYVLEYLKTIDFDLISFKKEENPHNKRKNVWMIKLKKRESPLDFSPQIVSQLL